MGLEPVQSHTAPRRQARTWFNALLLLSVFKETSHFYFVPGLASDVTSAEINELFYMSTPM